MLKLDLVATAYERTPLGEVEGVLFNVSSIV
jgi:hypothetical protein